MALETQFSGHSGVGLTVGLSDLEVLSNPSDSVSLWNVCVKVQLLSPSQALNQLSGSKMGGIWRGHPQRLFGPKARACSGSTALKVIVEVRLGLASTPPLLPYSTVYGGLNWSNLYLNDTFPVFSLFGLVTQVVLRAAHCRNVNEIVIVTKRFICDH